MALSFKEYSLSEAGIETASTDLQTFLAGQNMEDRSIQRFRLAVEELLLNLLKKNAGMKIDIGLGRRFGRTVFQLRYVMEPFDPTQSSRSESDDLLRLLDLSPSWSCRGHHNTVSMTLAERPKRSILFYILLSIFLAVLLGAAGSVMTEDLRKELTDYLLIPLADGFMGLLRTFSGLMILMTVCSGITGMGDPRTAERLGRGAVLRFVLISVCLSAAGIILSLPFLTLHFNAGTYGGNSLADELSQMFFNILPQNIIDPFITGNALQIIVIAAFLGVGLLAVGEKGGRLRETISEAAVLVQRIVSFICSLVPVFIFSTILRQIWSGNAAVFLNIFKPVLLMVLIILVLSAGMWILSSVRLKASPVALAKKAFPVFMVAFTSASSLAAMPMGMETCEQKYGIPKRLVSVLYPLGMVMYRPAGVIYFTVMTACFAEIYHLEISLLWLVMAVGISTMLIIALPPTPGNSLLGFSILFGTLGIPMEALALAMAMDIVLDFIDTGFNTFLLILKLACEADRQGSLDRRRISEE